MSTRKPWVNLKGWPLTFDDFGSYGWVQHSQKLFRKGKLILLSRFTQQSTRTPRFHLLRERWNGVEGSILGNSVYFPKALKIIGVVQKEIWSQLHFRLKESQFSLRHQINEDKGRKKWAKAYCKKVGLQQKLSKPFLSKTPVSVRKWNMISNLLNVNSYDSLKAPKHTIRLFDFL